MSDQLLEILDELTSAQAASLIKSLDGLRAKVDAARDAVKNADATVQALRSGGATAASARDALQAIVQVDALLQPLDDALLEQIGYDTQEAASFIETLENGLSNPATLDLEDVKALSPVIEAFDQAQSFRPDVDLARNFFAKLLPELLSKETDLDVGGKTITLRLRSKPEPGRSPFHPQAGMTAEAVYEGGFRVEISSIFFRVNPGSGGGVPFPVIDWTKAKLNPGFDLDSATSLLQGALDNIDIPLPVKIENVRLLPASGAVSPRDLALDVSFTGIPVLTDLSFSAGLQIRALGPPPRVAATKGATITIPGPFLIGTTGFAFESFGIGYQPPPDNKVAFTSRLGPAAPGAGKVVALKATVTIPLKGLSDGIGFSGDFQILTTSFGQVLKGVISTEKIEATLVIPGPGPSPFPSGIYEMNAHFLLDETGLSCDGDFTIFKVFTGDMKALIGFNGAGFVNGNAKALLSDAHISGSWKPGMKDLVAGADASAEVKLGPLKAATASVRLDGKRVGNSVKIHIHTRVFGISIDEDIDAVPETSLVDFLAARLKKEEKNAVQVVFNGLKNVFKALEKAGYELVSNFTRVLAGLDVFNKNSEAGKVVEKAKEELKKLGIDPDEPFKIPIDLPDLPIPIPNPIPLPPLKKLLQRVGPTGLSLTDNDADASANDIESSARQMQAFCDGLATTPVARRFVPDTNTSPEKDERVELGVELMLDQIQGALVEAKPDGTHVLAIGFLVSGTTFARRASRARQSNVAVWGLVTVTHLPSGPARVVGRIDIPNFVDSSLLGARQVVYQAVKAKLVQTHGGAAKIKFNMPPGDINKDPNDPGPPPKPDLSSFPPQPVDVGAVDFDPGTPTPPTIDFDLGTPISGPPPLDEGEPISPGSGLDEGEPSPPGGPPSPVGGALLPGLDPGTPQ